MKAVVSTDLHLPGQVSKYTGKVRDVYSIEDDYLVMVATDRISAFDVVLPEGIPYKGQVLNQIASKFLDLTEDILPNWKIAEVDPMVTVGHRCRPYKVEMVVRGYLAGHAWREYKAGRRTLCGVALPEGLRENEKLPQPIITPTTKAAEGHDEDISRDEIELFSDLLETAYTRRLVSGDDDAREAISGIRYFLHGRGIDIVDFASDTAGWFERLPAPKAGTIRPALAAGGRLIRKGIASE